MSRAWIWFGCLGFGLIGCAETVKSPQGAHDFVGTDGSSVEAESGRVSYIERAVGGANLADALPMLVVIHGRGGRPENMANTLGDLPYPARLIAPRGDAHGGGFSWWERPPAIGRDSQTFAENVGRAEARVAELVRRLVHERPTRGRPVVTGFSQGGILSFSLAFRDPDLFAASFPLSGMLPPLLPTPAWQPGVLPPPIHAFHGDADAVISIDADRQSVLRLRALGVKVELTEYAGMPHTVSPTELRDVFPAIEAALAHEALGEIPKPVAQLESRVEP